MLLRKVSLVIAIAASVSVPAVAFAASVHGKRYVVHRWHGYGFLPGYHQPPNNSVPIYRSKEFNPRRSRLCAKLLVRRRLVLLRRARLLPGSLEWGKFWSVLDLDAYRTDVELRMRPVLLVANSRHGFWRVWWPDGAWLGHGRGLVRGAFGSRSRRTRPFAS